jgi:hypothetical protein
MGKHPYDDDSVLTLENGTEFSEEERYSWFEDHLQNYMNVLRDVRNEKLIETDWVITKHSEEGLSVPDEWKTYRQALRDITKKYEKLEDAVWPTKPE